MWYMLYIVNKFNETIQRAVYVKNEWDLMAVIGYIHSSSTVGINAIWYNEIKQNAEFNKETNELKIFYPNSEKGVCIEVYNYLLTKIKMNG